MSTMIGDIYVRFSDEQCAAYENDNHVVIERMPWSELNEVRIQLGECLRGLSIVYGAMVSAGDRWETNPTMRLLFKAIQRRRWLQTKFKNELTRRQFLHTKGLIEPEMVGAIRKRVPQKEHTSALGNPHSSLKDRAAELGVVCPRKPIVLIQAIADAGELTSALLEEVRAMAAIHFAHIAANPELQGEQK